MIEIRKYTSADAEGMVDIWNDIVRDGLAFPQDEELTIEQVFPCPIFHWNCS